MPESNPENRLNPKRFLFSPKLFTTFKTYSWKIFTQDLTAGVIVGIVALPLAIAFAIASGVSPDRGLITAIIAGFLISVLGGSKVQIGGPTGAFVVIVYGIVNQYGLDGLLLSSMIAGVFLVVLGIFRLGSVIKFIPYPLTVGFTSGIAVVIFSSQIRDFLGLEITSLPAEFHEKWITYFHHLGSTDLATLGLSLLSLVILLTWPKISKRIPASLMAILIITALVQIFQIKVETIGSRFGDLPTGLPFPHFPSLTFEKIKNLISPAFTIAMLGSIESLLSATVADGMMEGRHRSNTELIAQGIANFITPLFGGIPATGAIARTATNIKNGAKTPVAGMIHAFTLLLIVLLFGKWAKMIPLCVLSAILIVVSYHMSEWRTFKALLRAPKMDVAVLMVTFFLTVWIDLTVAVEVGLVLSVILFMKRMTDVSSIEQITSEIKKEGMDEAPLSPPPPGVVVYEVKGALFFGVAEMLKDLLDFGNPPRVMIFRMREVLALDATGLQALTDLLKKCVQKKTQLLLSGTHSQPLTAMERSGFLEKIGKEYVFKNFNDALNKARSLNFS